MICRHCEADALIERPRPDTPHYAESWCKACQRHNAWVAKPENEKQRASSTTGLAQTEYCQLCLRYADEIGDNRTLEGHHVIPVKCGGTNDKENIWTLCTACHKHVEWMRRYLGNMALRA